MDQNKINNLITNIINNFIPKSKLNKFSKLIQGYGFVPSDFTYITKEKQLNDNIEKLKIRLFEKVNISEQSLTEQNLTEQSSSLTDYNEVITRCDKINNKIKFIDNKNKIIYYQFGECLLYLKLLFTLQGKTKEEYFTFIENRYTITRSTIYKYLKFNELCKKYSILMECNIGFDEIMKHVPDINNILSTHIRT